MKMKRKHLKNAMSVTLAVAMLSTSLVGNVANASVIVPSDTDVGTGSGTITTENSVTVDASTSSDGIVTTDDGIEISAVKENLTSAVQVADNGITVEDEDGLKAGSKVKLSVSAGNKSSETAKFKLYFWNYADKLPEDKTTWKSLLKDVPEKLTAEGTATINSDGTEMEAKATFMQDKDGDTSTASYVEVELPANSTLSLDVDVSNEAAGKVVAVPYLETTDETAYGDALGIDWEEDGITVDDSIVIEDTSSDEEDENGIKVDSETEEDGVTVDDEAENDGIEVEADTEKTEDAVTVDDTVDADLFTSQRLVVLTDDASVIRADDTVLGQYDNIYLLEYASVDETMDAYTYYKDLVTAVEPDAPMDAAEEDGIEVESDVATMTAEDNPIAVLNDTAENEAVVPETSGAVIALIDTGVSESKNVIDRVSLIGDALEGNGHGNDMLQAIIDQNKNANVLSVRVMGDDGRGTVSSIIAGMEYAMNQNAEIINLSLSSKINLANSVLAAEIEKAVDAGVTVVGAAGNDNDDVKNYMPGSVDVAMIVGAADKTGVRLETSNYGDTVDYNIVAGSTSEAAAKFSGFLSTGTDIRNVLNKKLVYDPYFEPYDDSDSGITIEPDDTVDIVKDNQLPDDSEDKEWQIGDYPVAYSNISKDETVWVKDTDFNFANYNPYDDGVTVTCTDAPNVVYDVNNSFEFTYQCALKDNADYTWNLYVTFGFTDDRELASVKSENADNIMPDVVTQERNEGYGGTVPKHVGDTVEGKIYNVLADTKDFDLGGLLQDYNPETFKVNNITENGFDIHTPGTYTVTFEMSYFMYAEYTWFVKDTVNVIDPATLEPGVYLTSTESTLTFTGADGQKSGYGEFTKVDADSSSYDIDCVYDADDYKLAVASSDKTVSADDVCTITDVNETKKQLQISVPDVSSVVLLSVYRPEYHAMKAFTGGGWKSQDILENQVSEISDFDTYENTTLTGEDDETMHVAANGWTTIASTSMPVTALSGGVNTTNHGWYSGNYGATNYGTCLASSLSSNIVNWSTKQGFKPTSAITNFPFYCETGSDYLGLPANTYYSTTLSIRLEKSSSGTRLFMSMWLQPGSDREGNYQGFYGSKSYSTTPKGSLVIRKRMLNAELANFSGRIGGLNTTFGVYNNSKCTDKETTCKISDAGSVDSDGYVSYRAEKELDPGQYWIKETKRINGTITNGEIYGPVTVKAGETTDVGKQFIGNPKYDNIGKTGWIYNKPFFFRGRIALKVGDDGKKLQNAVLRVQYSDYGGKDFKSKRTWYFKTDSNGLIYFDEDHYLKSWKDSKGTVHKSGALLHLTNGKPALPIGYLQIKEVEAPEGYQLDKEVYEIQLKADSVTDINISTIVDGKKGTLEIIDPAGGDFSLGKFLYDYDNFAGKTSRDYIKTEFTIYRNFNKDEPDNTKALSDVVKTIKIEDTAKNLKSKSVKVTGLQPGTYYLFETGRCPGAAQNLNIYSFTIAAGQKDFTITNVRTGNTGTKIGNRPFRYTGKLLGKVDANGNPLKLKDAIFKVVYSPYRQSESGYQEMYTWFLKTDANGELYYDKDHWVPTWNGMKSDDPLVLDDGNYAIPSGTIYLTEVEAPDGYDVDGKTHELLLDGKKDENGYYSIPELTATPIKVVEPEAGDKWKVRVNLKKVDEDGNGLAGAIFGVWDNPDCTGEMKAKLTSKDDGTTNIAVIKTIKWETTTYKLWCKEIQPPAGYTQIKDKFSLTFERSAYEELRKKDPDTNGELKPFGPKTGIPNVPGWTVRVHAKKVNQKGEGLEGAEFTVYTDKNMTDKSIVGTLTSDDNGDTNILSVGVDASKSEITLYAKETCVPEYCEGTDEVFHATFKKTDYDALKKAGDKTGELKPFGPKTGIVNTETPPPSVTPTPNPTPKVDGPGVHVVKHSTAPSDMLDLNSYSLAGATFSVTSADGFNGTLTTDETGVSNTLTLPDNSDKKWVPEQKNEAGEVIQSGYWNIIPKTTIYTIKETTPPKNHKITEKSPKYISVTMPYQKDTTFTVTFDDDIITCKPLELEKLGVKGNLIEGVVYKVEYFDGPDDSDDPVRTWYLTTDKNGKIYMDTSHVSTLPQYHSDPFFTYKGNVVLPVDGYLKATEVQAPAEYVVKDTPVTFVTSENQDMSTMVYNDMERCKVNLKKYDNDGKAIAGVEFELKFVKAAIPLTDRKNQYFSRLLDEGKTVVRSTDWEGNCYFDNLDQGDYEITEIKTAMGQTMLKDPIKFTLPFKMTQQEAIDYGKNLDMSKAKEDKDYTNKFFFFECTYEITNTPTFGLPETGATGTWNYGFVGLGIALAAGGCGAVGTIVIKRRRRKKLNK